jgi:hypothetical protein
MMIIKPTYNISLIELVILGYCTWQARELFKGWQSSPLENGVWMVFLIWLSPVILYYLVPSLYAQQKKKIAHIFLGLALLFSLIGTVSSLNTLHYFSVAIALAAMLPSCWLKSLWIIFAFIWMPGFGWMESYYLGRYGFVTRIALAGIITTAMMLTLIKNFSTRS